MKSLAQLRSEIDALDLELLNALNRRAALANEVGEVKRSEGSVVYRPEREAQVIARLQGSNTGVLRKESIAPIWREIMSACRSLEASQRVAVLGPAGTFCEEAAFKFFGSSIELIYCANFDQVFQATAAGSAHFGVVGVENSTEGPVTRSLDLMLHTPAQIIGEVSLMVRHHVVRLTKGLDGIEAVVAHPQALAQCQEWLTKHLPNAERKPVSSNAEGARLAAQNPSWAALSSERAATIFGLHVAAHAVQDDAHNRTRFSIIALPENLPTPAPTGKDCTSLIVSVPNKPGAVHDLLVPLKEHGVSMTRFESRPARTAGQWEYYFYIDISGHAQEPHVAAALSQLRSLCAYFKLLGSYPLAA